MAIVVDYRAYRTVVVQGRTYRCPVWGGTIEVQDGSKWYPALCPDGAEVVCKNTSAHLRVVVEQYIIPPEAT